MHLVDTSALLALRKGITSIGNRIKQITEGEHLAIASPSVFELLDGATKDEFEKTELLLSQSEVLPLTHEAAHLSAKLSNQLKKSGKTVSKIDLFIAAIALEHNLQVITLDTDFQRIPNLKAIILKP